MFRILQNLINLLRRSQWASVLNIAGLSAAFAVFTAVLMQVHYEYSYNESFPKAKQIYRLETGDEGGVYSPFIPKPFVDLVTAEIPEMSRACVIGKPFSSSLFTVVDANGVKVAFEEYPGYADTGVIRMFDLDIVAGNARQALETKTNLLMPATIARKFFGKEDVVGKTVLVDGSRELTIAAVYRDVAENSTFKNVIYSAAFATGFGWGQWNYDSYYEIADGVDFELLKRKLRGLDKLVVARDGEENFMSNQSILFRPLTDVYFANMSRDNDESGNRPMTNILLLIGVLILVVAAVNFVNFSTALAPSRIKGLNTQKVFGATNAFLRWSVISEAMLFAFLSFLLGIFLCYLLSISLLQEIVYVSLNPLHHIGLVLFVAAVSVLLGVCAGCYPAFYMTSFLPALVLKGSQALSPRGVFLRNSLVVFQYTVSFVLIISTFFVGRQLEMMKNRPWGIEKEHVLYIKTNRALSGQRDAFFNELRVNPAILDITSATDLLGNVGMQNWIFDAMVDGSEQEIECKVCCVAPNYLNFFGIQVKEGDPFIGIQDTMAVVNEAFGATYNFDPMGKELVDMRVKKVMKDFNFFPMQEDIKPLMLLVNSKYGDNTYNYIKINAASRLEAVEHVRKTISRFAPDYPCDVKFLDDELNRLYQKEERLGKLVSFFGLVTILISLMGVYGLVLFNAKFKAKEIGVRKVNGATEGQIIGMLNGGFIRLIVVSFVVACPLAWFGVSAWLDRFAYKTPLSLWIFCLAGGVVLFITLLTITYQSWRAATTNPVEVLKSE